MKKQTQNSTQVNTPATESNYPNPNVNQAFNDSNKTQPESAMLNKRERDSKDNLPSDVPSEFKKQKIENDSALEAKFSSSTSNNINNTFNSLNTNNYSSTSNSSLSNPSSSMFNIINNSPTGNINVNVNLNSYMNSAYPNSNVYGMNNSTYNMYQNLSHGIYNKLSNVPVNPNNQFVYSSLYGNSRMNNMNANSYSGMYSNRLNSSMNYMNPSSYYKNAGQEINPNANVTSGISCSSAEKKKYVIKDFPEMTVGSYLHNKNTQDMYLNTLKKKEDETEESQNISVSSSSNADNQFLINNSNNIVLQTKSVQAKINKVGSTNAVSGATVQNSQNQMLSKTVNYTTIGNVITFNKTPTPNQVATKQTAPTSNIISTPNTNKTIQTIQSPNKSPSKPGEFSDSLQKYIQRSYEKCKSEVDRTNCQKALMKIMGAALKKGDLNTRDWNKHALPILPSELGQQMQRNLTEQELKNREKRKGRFSATDSALEKPTPSVKETSATSFEELTNHIIIVGTCQSLEKQYLRLTTLPDPSQIRPEIILHKSLKMLKDKWKKKEGDYNYTSEQLRSIRQDMTIQHIQNEFTVKVYETHARIALESLDLDQFNQCQTALISLYDLGLKGSNVEFLAYRIIYTNLQGIKYDMENLLKDVYKMEKKSGVISKHMEISHALKVMKAINTNNYFEFFNLYKIAPNMASNLIEPFLPRLRIKALQAAALGFYTEVNVDYLYDKLAFESIISFLQFLEENQIVLSNDKKKILCKESITPLNNCKLLTAMQYKISNIY